NLAATQAVTGGSVPSTPLLVVAVLGASVDVTVTLLDCVFVNVDVLLRDEWPDALTISVTDAFSPTAAVNVHCPVLPGAIAAGGHVTLVAVPSNPVAPA